MSIEEKTRTSNAAYDIVSVMYHALQGAETYDRYIADAQERGDQELVQTSLCEGNKANRLPADLQPALERGKAQRRPARPVSLDAFLAMIADREGVDRGQAAEHARAVFDVLREVIGEDEFRDTTAQLPGQYRVLLRRG